jgi:hypothetical protein
MVDTARPRPPLSARVALSLRSHLAVMGLTSAVAGPGTSRFPFLTAYGS